MLKLKELEEKKKKKLEKKKLKADVKSDPTNGAKTVEDLLQNAEKKQVQFDKVQASLKQPNPFDHSSAKNGDKETSLKTFYKEFKKVVDAADVIIEVLDARDPMGSRCPQAEEMIMNSTGANKKLILLLNKIGIITTIWAVKFFREFFTCFFFV